MQDVQVICEQVLNPDAPFFLSASALTADSQRLIQIPEQILNILQSHA